MSFEYYAHRVIRAGDDIELRRRHLHARLRAEARAGRDARSSRRSRVIGVLRTWRRHWPWRRRHAGPSTAGALPATIAGAVVGLSGVGLDVEVTEASTAPEPLVEAVGAVLAPEPVVEMTAASCRLPDGSMGRIAILRDADDDWRAVCLVPPPAADPGAYERG